MGEQSQQTAARFLLGFRVLSCFLLAGCIRKGAGSEDSLLLDAFKSRFRSCPRLSFLTTTLASC